MKMVSRAHRSLLCQQAGNNSALWANGIILEINNWVVHK